MSKYFGTISRVEAADSFGFKLSMT